MIIKENQPISDLTPTELLKAINGCQKKHEKIKTEMIDELFEVENLEKSLNEKSTELTKCEEIYVLLIEELNNRGVEHKHNENLK